MKHDKLVDQEKAPRTSHESNKRTRPRVLFPQCLLGHERRSAKSASDHDANQLRDANFFIQRSHDVGPHSPQATTTQINSAMPTSSFNGLTTSVRIVRKRPRRKSTPRCQLLHSTVSRRR